MKTEKTKTKPKAIFHKDIVPDKEELIEMDAEGKIEFEGYIIAREICGVIEIYGFWVNIAMDRYIKKR